MAEITLQQLLNIPINADQITAATDAVKALNKLSVEIGKGKDNAVVAADVIGSKSIYSQIISGIKDIDTKIEDFDTSAQKYANVVTNVKTIKTGLTNVLKLTDIGNSEPIEGNESQKLSTPNFDVINNILSAFDSNATQAFVDALTPLAEPTIVTGAKNLGVALKSLFSLFKDDSFSDVLSKSDGENLIKAAAVYRDVFAAMSSFEDTKFEADNEVKEGGKNIAAAVKSLIGIFQDSDGKYDTDKVLAIENLSKITQMINSLGSANFGAIEEIGKNPNGDNLKNGGKAIKAFAMSIMSIFDTFDSSKFNKDKINIFTETLSALYNDDKDNLPTKLSNISKIAIGDLGNAKKGINSALQILNIIQEGVLNTENTLNSDKISEIKKTIEDVATILNPIKVLADSEMSDEGIKQVSKVINSVLNNVFLTLQNAEYDSNTVKTKLQDIVTLFNALEDELTYIKPVNEEYVDAALTGPTKVISLLTKFGNQDSHSTILHAKDSVEMVTEIIDYINIIGDEIEKSNDKWLTMSRKGFGLHLLISSINLAMLHLQATAALAPLATYAAKSSAEAFKALVTTATAVKSLQSFKKQEGQDEAIKALTSTITEVLAALQASIGVSSIIELKIMSMKIAMVNQLFTDLTTIAALGGQLTNKISDIKNINKGIAAISSIVTTLTDPKNPIRSITLKQMFDIEWKMWKVGHVVSVIGRIFARATRRAEAGTKLGNTFATMMQGVTIILTTLDKFSGEANMKMSQKAADVLCQTIQKVIGTLTEQANKISIKDAIGMRFKYMLIVGALTGILAGITAAGVAAVAAAAASIVVIGALKLLERVIHVVSNVKVKDLLLAQLALVGIGGIVVMLGFTIVLLDRIGRTIDFVSVLASIGGIALLVAIMCGIVYVLNKFDKDILKGVLILGVLTGIFFMLSLLLITIQATAKELEWGSIGKFFAVVGGLLGVAVLIGLIASSGVGAVIMGAGLVFFATFAGVVLLLSSAIEKISIAMANYQEGTMTKTTNALKELYDGVNAIPILDVLEANAKLTLMMPSFVSLGLLSWTLSQFAELNIPTEWDENGRPIKFKQMKEDDFAQVVSNMSMAVNAVLDAISVVDDKMSVADAIGDAIIFTFMGKTVTPISNMVKMIMDLAQGRIASEFDPTTGKPTKYVAFDKIDYGAVSSNIALCISSYANALKNSGLEDDSHWFSEDGPLTKAVKGIELVADSVDPVTKMVNMLEKLNGKKIDPKNKVFETVLTQFVAGVRKFEDMNADKVEDAVDAIDDLDDILDTLINIDDKKAKAHEQFMNNNIKFLDKINTVKTDNIRGVADMFEKMAEFSETINGNFEKLAEAFSQELIDALNNLSDALGGGTTVTVAAANVNAVQEQHTAPAAQTQPSVDPQQISNILNTINDLKNILQQPLTVTTSPSRPLVVRQQNF